MSKTILSLSMATLIAVAGIAVPRDVSAASLTDDDPIVNLQTLTITTEFDKQKERMTKLEVAVKLKALEVRATDEKIKEAKEETQSISEQKDSLATEVARLKAEVEAKQAEAEAKKQAALAAEQAAAASQIVAQTVTPRYNQNTAGNGYTAGQCTYYVKNRRPDIPNNWGNADQWYYNAQAAGYSVGSQPVVGAIAAARGEMHVAYVEGVSGDMVTISEMNYGGPWVMNTRTVPSHLFLYIY